MKPVIQTKLHDPKNKVYGNCTAAAFASILELSLSEVPKFENMKKGRWFSELKKWLEDLGFMILEWEGEVSFLSGYYLVSGDSPRGVKHFVIYKDGKLAHDPHPLGEGLVTIDCCWALLPFSPVSFKIKREVL